MLFSFNDHNHFWKATPALHRSASFGWLPDQYDSRDHAYLFRAPTEMLRNLPKSVDNRKYFKDISSQWHMPSCTANAGADYIEAMFVQHMVAGNMPLEDAVRSVPNLSRMFLWWNGRNEMDPPKQHDEKSGCYNRLIMDVAARFGVPPEGYWPYDEQLLPPNYDPRPIVRPSLTSYRVASRYRLSSYHSICSDGGRVGQVKTALLHSPGVLFGTALTAKFRDVGSSVLLRPAASDRIIARHAMVICGYNEDGNFLVRNSHGKSFGMDGYLWMHPDYISWSQSNSFWIGKV